MAHNDIDFYLKMRHKYKSHKVELIDDAWGEVSANLGRNGMTVYTDEGQAIISEFFDKKFNA